MVGGNDNDGRFAASDSSAIGSNYAHAHTPSLPDHLEKARITHSDSRLSKPQNSMSKQTAHFCTLTPNPIHRTGIQQLVPTTSIPHDRYSSARSKRQNNGRNWVVGPSVNRRRILLSGSLIRPDGIVEVRELKGAPPPQVALRISH